MRLLIFFMLYVNYTLTRKVDYCFANVKHSYLGFASKTPYRFVSNGKIEDPLMPNCKPIQIWMFARHATRYPQNGAIARLREFSKTADEIIKNHEEGGGHLCPEDVESLRRWMSLPNMSFSTVNIATEGWREGHQLGRIYKKAYPSLLEPSALDMNIENYVFNSKRRKRAEYSMYAFMEGVFGNKTAVQPAAYVTPNYVLEPEKHCPLWSQRVSFSKNSERDRFIEGPDYRELVINVSRRLGFDVTPEEIHNIQDVCRFEMAWLENYKSPWCGIFTEDEWKLLEYIDDIQYYYYSAEYGVEANSLLSCFLVQDMLDRFREIENGETDGKPKATFYFSNSKLLLGLLSALGIAKDSQILRADNFKELINRKWKTGHLAPFFGNFLATFYSCSDSNSSNKVTFHLQEKLIPIEGCPTGICDWNYLKRKFSKPAGQCIKDCIYVEHMLPGAYVHNSIIIITAVILLYLSFRRCIIIGLKKATRRISMKIDASNSSKMNLI